MALLLPAVLSPEDAPVNKSRRTVLSVYRGFGGPPPPCRGPFQAVHLQFSSVQVSRCLQGSAPLFACFLRAGWVFKYPPYATSTAPHPLAQSP